MFNMFLSSPPAATPVDSVYREKQAFGPYTVGSNRGFSVGVIMEIAETAPAEFRNVRTCCLGRLQIVGVQPGSSPDDPNAPLLMALVPELGVAQELTKIGRHALLEPPLAFLYLGIDPSSVQAKLMPIIETLRYLSFFGQAASASKRWEAFRSGEPIPIHGGFAFGEVSAANLSNGFRSFGFAVRTNAMNVPDTTTEPLNFLDPVRLYQRLITERLDDGSDAVPQTEVTNSWLDVATKNRVIVTFRDEWNAPLVDQAINAVLTDGSTQHTVPLTLDRQGTLVVPSGMSRWNISLPGRKLTTISDPVSQGVAFPSTDILATGPQHHVLGSVRPEDWFHPQDPRLTDVSKELPLYTEGNAVEALIDGFETFSRIVADLKKIDSSNHFFLFTNWWTEHEFQLVPGDTTSTLKKLMEDADAVSAPIRSLIWHHFGANNQIIIGFNKPAHYFIRSLAHGQSVLDSRTHHAWLPVPFIAPLLESVGPIGAAMIANEGAATSGTLNPYHLGAHHAKTALIRNRTGTVAYIGGIDFNANRLDGPDHSPSDTRFHDVHSRIVGPAALDLTRAFVDRWSDHPDNQVTVRKLKIGPPSNCTQGETCIQPTTPGWNSRATCMVQIAQTFGASTLSHAPNGNRTIWATLKQAIDRAKKYVYIEDQYLVSPELSSSLLTALSRIDHLVIVIDHYGESFPVIGPAEMARARFLFLKPLRDAYKNKLHVFTLQKDGEPYKIHTKVVIIDDVFATIGSANMNRRGFTHDTEANAFILDGTVENGARKFARDLRISLWAEHLGWHRDPDRALARLSNVDEAVKILATTRPSTARVVPYDYSRGNGSAQLPGWDTIFDPDGTMPPP